MSVSCECYVLSGTGIYDGPISRPEELPSVCLSLSAIRLNNDTLHLQLADRNGSDKARKREGNNMKGLTGFMQLRTVTSVGIL